MERILFICLMEYIFSLLLVLLVAYCNISSLVDILFSFYVLATDGRLFVWDFRLRLNFRFTFIRHVSSKFKYVGDLSDKSGRMYSLTTFLRWPIWHRNDAEREREGNRKRTNYNQCGWIEIDQTHSVPTGYPIYYFTQNIRFGVDVEIPSDQFLRQFITFQRQPFQCSLLVVLSGSLRLEVNHVKSFPVPIVTIDRWPTVSVSKIHVFEILIDDDLINRYTTIHTIQSHVVDFQIKWMECIPLTPLGNDRLRMNQLHHVETLQFVERIQMFGMKLSWRTNGTWIPQHNFHNHHRLGHPNASLTWKSVLLTIDEEYHCSHVFLQFGFGLIFQWGMLGFAGSAHCNCFNQWNVGLRLRPMEPICICVRGMFDVAQLRPKTIKNVRIVISIYFCAELLKRFYCQIQRIRYSINAKWVAKNYVTIALSRIGYRTEEWSSTEQFFAIKRQIGFNCAVKILILTGHYIFDCNEREKDEVRLTPTTLTIFKSIASNYLFFALFSSHSVQHNALTFTTWFILSPWTVLPSYTIVVSWPYWH